MMSIIKADFLRLRKSAALLLSLMGMLLLAAGFMFIQATAMDYTVPLSRVIFLPMSMYGMTMAAFVSVFAGTDFSDGFIRNKLMAADSRAIVVLSQTIICSLGCLIVYFVVTAFSALIGRFFFVNNVIAADFVRFFFVGIGMSVSTGCLFSIITMVCGNKTQAIVLCMALAFAMLFLCLHTNEVLAQTEYKNGVLNPHYVGGFRRALCSLLHDINPCGQAAQLSAWKVWHPARALMIDLVMIVGSCALGCALFCRKDIR